LKERLSDEDCLPMISVVTVGEILSFGMQAGWGEKKMQAVQGLMTKIVRADINSADIDLLNAYAETDAFSKGKTILKHASKSAIKMGKNDLWIAATAKVAGATLLTIDSDFDHLNSTFIQVKKYQRQ
jgi:tRNA(fMet)-specific endonuclease VapC